jgi:putative NADH-flavin reductase
LINKLVTTTLQRLGLAACACLLLSCVSQPPILESEPPIDDAAVAGEHYTVALLGATGMVGGYLLREALSRGHTVRALARTPAKLDAWRDQVTIIEGDARDPAIIEQLLRGSDVVINALGPVKADGNASRGINTAVTANILHALEGKAISQYMVVSGAAVVMPGDERNLLGWWIRKLAQVGLHNTLQDKQAEYELLAESSADWMLVRCPLIDAESFVTTPLFSLKTPPAFRVRAGDLASFMIDQVDAREFVRQGPFLGSH